MSTIIELSELRLDGGTQPREAINPETVQEYADDMRKGDVFPDVEVYHDGSNYWLVDGYHRVEAAKQVGADRITCEVFQGDQRAAILYSVGANGKHGLRRTNADKRRAVLRLLHDPEWSQWSNVEIARHCGVTDPFVLAIRAELSSNDSKIPTRRIVTRNGKTYTMNTDNIGVRQADPERGKRNLGFKGQLEIDHLYPIDGRTKTIYDHPLTYDEWKESAMAIGHVYPGCAMEKGQFLMDLTQFKDFSLKPRRRLEPPPQPEPQQQEFTSDEKRPIYYLLGQLEELINLIGLQPDLVRECLAANDYSDPAVKFVSGLLDRAEAWAS